MSELANCQIETLRKDGEFTVARARRPDGLPPWLLVLPVLEQPAPASVARLEHAFALRDELDAAWAARPVELMKFRGQPTLVVDDPGGQFLDELIAPSLAVPDFLRMAIGIAKALANLHARRLVHKDVKPENLIVKAESGEAWLTGFGLTSRLPRHRQAPEPPEGIAGTLAYMAPEQTGRMNRSIDSRSDLYALGVTLYEALVGALPFAAGDPMEWIHCHIAREPIPPCERCSGIPDTVSAIVMKLMAKTPEARYQTASGAEADFRRCLAAWESQGRIDPFPLGDQDVSDQLLIPGKLYGREKEIEQLLAAFDRVVRQGATELVLVSGYSGVGKSSVVNELHKVLVAPRSLFASGKFDQYKRDIPYATLAQAFQRLIRSILAKSETELGRWRKAFLRALDPHGALIIDLVPELKLIVGEQEPVPELPAPDAQRRFQFLLRRFIGVFARPEHPLALFLDDLQWLDAATLDLLEDLLSREDVSHLLLIGAYRDNEVDASHPLMRKLGSIKAAGASSVNEITLRALNARHVSQLIADALRCETDRVKDLTELIFQKTDGNPFFINQFLATLTDEGLLAFDFGHSRWTWDLKRIHAKGYTDNVADLMIGKLARLPAATQQALQQLACLGNIAPIAMLAVVHDTTEQELHDSLVEARRQELVDFLEHSYRFVHDRVHEAAYALIPTGRRAALHLQIGRRLVAETPPGKLDESIFEIVNQLNRGAALITRRDERVQLAEFNLLAGQRAKQSTAYHSALTYLAAGRALLPEDCWERSGALTFALEFHRAECEFLTGALAAAEERLSMLAGRAGRLVAFASVTNLQAELFTTLGRSDRAIEACFDYLRHVGIEWSAHPFKEEVRQEYERLRRQMGRRSIEELVDLPPMTDPEWRATMDVLTAVVSPALFTDENLLCLVICRMANLSLEHGNGDGSCFAYAWLGMLLGPHFGDYRAGFRFGKLGLDLVEQRGLRRFEARVYLIFGHRVIPWTQPIRTGRSLVRRAFDAANKSGDLTFAAYSCDNLITNLLASGDPLGDVQSEAEAGLDFARQARFGLVIDRITTQLRLIRTLRGLTPEFASFNDTEFDEGRFEQHLEEDPHLAIAACWYWIRKLQARFFAGAHASAMAAAANAERLLWTSPSFFELAEYHLYSALTRAALCDSVDAAERALQLEALALHHRQLQEWVENCPENFANRAALVGAEVARIEGRDIDAMRLYEQAIRSAREHDFVQNEGLAHEVAARFYAARGFETIACAYLRNARYCYLRWGADGKVRQLDRIYPHLAAPEGQRPAASIGSPLENLDVASVVKASQALSSEIVLPRLIERLMKIAIENAGADRGLLILPSGNKYLIQAEARATGDQIEVTVRQEPITPVACPESLVRYVIRTRESVILDDAAKPSLFSGDDYLRDQQSKSILCLPLIKQQELTGILFLENALTSHAFTPARTAVMKLLAAQAAISLENTHLYSDLQEREAKVRRLVESNIIGICIFDLDRRIIEANDAFLSIVGYSRDDVISGSLSFSGLTPPEWAGADERILAELAATGTCQPYEKEFFRKDGSRVPLLVGGATFGELRHQGVAFVLDLTERKRTEAELRRAHAQLVDEKHLFEMTASARPLGEILDAVCRLVEKISPECLCSVYPIDWSGPVFKYGVAPSLPASYIDPLKGWPVAVDKAPCGLAVAEDRQVIVVDIETDPIWRGTEYRDHMLSHGLRSVWSTLIRSQDGRVQGVLCVYQRSPATPTPLHQELISHATHIASIALDRDQANEALMTREAELRRANRYLTEAQRMSCTGSFTWDPARGEQDWSEEMFRIFEAPSGGELNLCQFMKCVHPEDVPAIEEELARVLATGDDYDLFFRITTRSGTLKHLHSVGQRLAEITDRHVYIGATQDITERKRAEEELRRNEAALREAQAELAHVSRVTTMGELAASIAHEINQPIAGIVINSNACLRWLDRETSQSANIAEAREAVERIVRDGARAGDVIARIRALFKKTETAREPLDLGEMIREVLVLTRSEMNKTRVALRLELAAELPCVLGDRVQLQQVTLNLILNAIEAMSAVEGRPRELLIRTQLYAEAEVLVTVSDSGIGLDPLKMEQMFTAFHTTKPGGLGMGLSISRSIVEGHAGRLWATANDGPGATLQFTLPTHRPGDSTEDGS